jgi:DNA-binding NtrC family response regulator
MTNILIIDWEIGFMWALAEGLERRAITTIPATSVETAKELLGSLQPELSLLMVNCASRGVCAFAGQLRSRYPSLKVIGIISQGRLCRQCAGLLAATLSDPEDRSPDRLPECIELICTLVGRSGAGGLGAVKGWPG